MLSAFSPSTNGVPAPVPVPSSVVEPGARRSPVSSPAALGIDVDGFLRDVRALRRELEAGLGQADLDHLKKIERWGRTATAIGLATCWIAPNPVSMVALSIGRGTRWLMMHHIGHRGYDKVPGVPPRYTSRVFARGRRRYLDWNDWMIPEAWMYEHNVLHHANTGEEKDPDLVERNTEDLRVPYIPKPLRYLVVAGLAATWRATYYAPSTLDAWITHRDRKNAARAARVADARQEIHADEAVQSTAGAAKSDDGTAKGKSAPKTAGGKGLAARLRHKLKVTKELVTTCYAPPIFSHLVVLPAAFLPLGPIAAANAFTNSLVAEVLTNIHTFFVVGPNHTGDDLWRFSTRPASQGESEVRQVLGSVNYATGTDTIDFAHLWLNYQIEHHLFPDLPMLKYQEAQPKVKALCEKYGIPYVQEGVTKRFKRLVDVMVGNTAMLRG